MEGRSFVGIGLVLGLIFGVAFGIALGNPVAGGVLGVVVGLVAGFALDARSRSKPARKIDRRDGSDATVPVFVDGGGDGVLQRFAEAEVAALGNEGLWFAAE